MSIILRSYRVPAVSVGGVAVGGLLESLALGHSLPDPGRPLTWSGTLALSELQGRALGFSLDERANALWTRGRQVVISLYNPLTSAYQVWRTLRISSAQYSPRNPRQTLQLTDALGLSRRSTATNVGGVTVGQSKTRLQTYRQALLDDGVPDGQIILPAAGLDDTFNYPLSKSGGESGRVAAAKLATAVQHWPWVRSDESIALAKWDSSVAAVLTRSSALLVDPDRPDYREYPPSVVRSSGQRITYSNYSAASAGGTESTTGALGQLPIYWESAAVKLANNGNPAELSRVDTTETGDGAANGSRTITRTTRVPRIVAARQANVAAVTASNGARVLNDSGTYGGTTTYADGYLYDSAGQITLSSQAELLISEQVITALTYDASGRTASQVVSTYRPRWATAGGQTVVPTPTDVAQNALTLALKVTEVYTYTGAATVVSSYQQTTETLNSPYLYGNSPGYTIVGPTTISGAPASPPGSIPSGSEVQSGIFGTYTVYIPVTGLDSEEPREITTDYCTDATQQQQAAEWYGKYLLGSYLGVKVGLEIVPALALDYQPFQKVTLDGVSYLMVAPSWGFTQEAGAMTFTGVRL